MPEPVAFAAIVAGICMKWKLFGNTYWKASRKSDGQRVHEEGSYLGSGFSTNVHISVNSKVISLVAFMVLNSPTSYYGNSSWNSLQNASWSSSDLPGDASFWFHLRNSLICSWLVWSEIFIEFFRGFFHEFLWGFLQEFIRAFLHEILLEFLDKFLPEFLQDTVINLKDFYDFFFRGFLLKFYLGFIGVSSGFSPEVPSKISSAFPSRILLNLS